jgi:hypothetical protein
MTRDFRNRWMICALGALSGTAYAQPPDVVASDANANTAMGTSALLHVTVGVGASNTAAGSQALESDTTGSDNSAFGVQSLVLNTTGSGNSAFGGAALFDNTIGSSNSAFGSGALESNTSGNNNSAFGTALLSNGTGSNNTAIGFQALIANGAGNSNSALGVNALEDSTGDDNTASGANALNRNSTGSRNNAAGGSAMFSNTSADDNNAMGYVAMYSNTTGTLNNAVGNFSLYFNTTGSDNNAVGYAALYHNTTGSNNSAQGFYALQNNTTGSGNIGIGEYAGQNLTTGGSNIDIGSFGVAGESAVIRIGSSAAQIATYIAGITNAKVTGGAVYVTSTGQLGVLASSERYKTEVASMGASSTKLKELRPVTFHLKADPKGALQYGLIAEEVAKVYPELVIRDATGRIEGVRYEELAPMLLNEVQQQAMQIRAMRGELAQLQDLKRQVRAVLRAQPLKSELVAER